MKKTKHVHVLEQTYMYTAVMSTNNHKHLNLTVFDMQDNGSIY